VVQQSVAPGTSIAKGSPIQVNLGKAPPPTTTTSPPTTTPPAN
jgi:beta-lactam-binding protein with PASTA domain